MDTANFITFVSELSYAQFFVSSLFVFIGGHLVVVVVSSRPICSQLVWINNFFKLINLTLFYAPLFFTSRRPRHTTITYFHVYDDRWRWLGGIQRSNDDSRSAYDVCEDECFSSFYRPKRTMTPRERSCCPHNFRRSSSKVFRKLLFRSLFTRSAQLDETSEIRRKREKFSRKEKNSFRSSSAADRQITQCREALGQASADEWVIRLTFFFSAVSI